MGHTFVILIDRIEETIISNRQDYVFAFRCIGWNYNWIFLSIEVIYVNT